MQKKTRRMIIAVTLTVSFVVGYITAPEEPSTKRKGEDFDMSKALRKQQQYLNDQWHYDRIFHDIVRRNADVY